jgi:eukaryotic-like serine/threonine-protein kinase
MSGELIGGRYELRRPVGRGGMGTVWLGTDQTLHRDVAVKRMGSLPGEDSAGTARAMREARSAAAMNHRNAVSVFDVVDHEDAPWLVMEYFPSRTLADIIREDGPLPPDRAGHIAAQVADALADAHKLGIMHRDVKPGNILVGDGDHAKISDFGIARAELDATLTQTGMMTGTPAYFAPELATGEDPTPASDVWALGATIYAAVEGDPPYGTQGNPLQLLSRIVQEPVPRPTHAGPLLPILGEMLSKDPRSRPTMHEAAEQLADLPAATRLVETPDRTRVAPIPPPVAPTGGVSSASPSGKGRRLVPLVLALLVVLALAAGGWALLRGGGGDDNTASTEPAGQTQRSDNDQQSDNNNPNNEPDDSQSSETPSSESQPTPDEGEEPSSGDPAAFVRQYYALMPEDTDTGWSMLGGDLKQQSRNDYEAFWSGIDSVTVSNVTETSNTRVEYDITYTETDGTQSSEHKVITLEERGNSYVIVADDGA